MTRIISLVDLDDTVFQTLRKCPADLPHKSLVPIGFDANGAPRSYATPPQMAFIDWLIETTYFIPVTARSLAALRRVRLPFSASICAHGGMILGDDGEVHVGWDHHIRSHAQAHAPIIKGLVEALDSASKATGLPIKARVQMEGDIALYPLARHETADEAALNRLADAVLHQLPEGWTDHRNSNVIAFLPPFLGKQHAVAHILPDLRKRFPDAMIIGIGDSLTDAPFMGLCDLAMTPTQSQLARTVQSSVFSA